ncbi:MAG: hypothetical protein N2B06_05155 [Clostridium sp.]
MNNSLLEEPEYTNLITNIIKKTECDLTHIDDNRLSWEFLKMVIRRETISYSIARNKRRNKEGEELLDKMKECEAKMENSIGSPEDIVNEYGILKKDYEQYLSEKNQRSSIKVKSKVGRTW